MTASGYSSKSDVAYAELRGRILDGRIEAGSALKQYVLADELSISITPLREAIRRLSGEGLVVLDAHRNARVAAMDPVEARELVEARRALESEAAGLAATRRTDEDVERMREALRHLLPVTREWGEPALVAHREVHRAIYTASHSSVLVHLLDDLWDKSDRYRRAGLQVPPDGEARARDFEEHGRLVDLVVERDSEGAAALMRSHVDRSVAATAIADGVDEEASGT
ncbi:GntR family transcriptional regulator [Nocardioides sediminis]|uniref:GntR family transcriptional regulator n=1 Tax=Nocardioides sediminis TaxID=433648 RepID=UPI000D31370F|nr:GntR family transcriptional regulator [Nocardioides sediminis]